MKNNPFKKIISLFLPILAGVLLLNSPVHAAKTVTYYHHDALGSPVAMTDESGNLKCNEDYMPYGERIRKEAGCEDNNIWYTGKPEEPDLGLQYFGARWYDPSIGRFTGIDPIKFQEGNIHSFNAYAYANNNPYLFVDPDGRLGISLIPRNGEPLNASVQRSAPGRAARITGGTAAVTALATYGAVQAIRACSGACAAGLPLFELQSIATDGPSISPKVGPVKQAPKISRQKQAGHIPGTPQNANRIKQGKPTSSFFGKDSGEALTQQAFKKGKAIPGRPNVKEHDFGFSTGTGPNGGMQSKVRVHQDSKGVIHGHPSGTEKF